MRSTSLIPILLPSSYLTARLVHFKLLITFSFHPVGLRIACTRAACSKHPSLDLTQWSGLESREYGREDRLRLPHDTLHLQKLALPSPRSVSRSVGIVRSRTEATEFSFFNPTSIWAGIVQLG
jgi:hypothetical protein